MLLMNELATKISGDANILLHDIRHQMAILGDISLIIETIMCNSYTLANEGDVEMLSNMFGELNDEALDYENIKEDFDVDMFQLMEDIKQLI